MEDPVKGCASPLLNSKNEFLPFAFWLIEARWGSVADAPVLETDIAKERYARALANSGYRPPTHATEEVAFGGGD